ncbi:asparagine synthase-related protein, partial [Chloroflexota bacterium]
KTYWEYPSEERQAVSKEEFSRLFNNHISTALKLEEKISLPLSGGMDTRTILSACLIAREHLHCYTHGMESSPDVRIARRIAWMLRLPHDVYTLDDGWIKNIPATAVEQVETFNGLLDLIRYLHLGNSYTREQNKGTLFIAGIFGGELLRGYWVNDEVANVASFDAVTVALRKRMQYPVARGVYRDFDGAEIDNFLTSAVRQELTGVEYKDYAPNFLSHSQRLAGRYFKVYNPILYHRFIEQSPRLGLAEKKSGYLQRYIIGMNSPALTRVLLATGQCVNEKEWLMRWQGYQAHMVRYFRGGVNLAARKLLGRQVFSTAYLVDYALWLRKYHRQYVREVLDYEQMMLKDFFYRPQLESAVNSFLDGRNELTHFITGLMSLEIWLRRALIK